MARPYRLQGEDCLYHIFSRGDDRKKIYAAPDDHGRFMDYVVKAKQRYQFHLYAYCLMPNHFHLLLETRLPNISRIMHYIKGSYTTYYNLRHGRCGHLFQGRFRSIVVDRNSYFLELTRYIHLNPVATGIVEDPAAYTWSSYRGYLGKRDQYLDHEAVARYLGMAPAAYRHFVLDGINKAVDPLKQVYAGFLLGPAAFVKDRLKDLAAQAANEEISQKRVLFSDHERAERIIRTVVGHFDTTLAALAASKARPMHAKQILIYLLREHSGLTNREIGDLLGMRYPAVSKAGLTIKTLLDQDKRLRNTVSRLVSSFQV